jgi:hypothetical protein
LDNITDREMGVQPLDALMNVHEMSNAALAGHSKEQLTIKEVNKARKGRLLTYNIQSKILRAMNAALPERVFTIKDLFNYEGRRK